MMLEYGNHWLLVGQHKFRLSLIVIDSLNLQIKLFCSKSFLNPRRVEVAILNDKAKQIFQNTVRIVANDKFPVEVEISKNAIL
jgi:hypothetical protein